jgi:hypothetical protein
VTSSSQSMNGSGLAPAVEFANALLQLPRSTKRLIMALVDSAAFPCALWLAFVLRYESFEPAIAPSAAVFVVAALSAVLVNPILGLYRSVIRFMGPTVGFAALGSAVSSAARKQPRSAPPAPLELLQLVCVSHPYLECNHSRYLDRKKRKKCQAFTQVSINIRRLNWILMNARKNGKKPNLKKKARQ